MPTTKTVQIVLDANLLQSADILAKKRNVNRSALVREALAKEVRQAELAEMEERERRAYAAMPQEEEEYLPWQRIASWPKE